MWRREVSGEKEMMSRNWKEQFPGVPEQVHRAVMETLGRLEEETVLSEERRQKVYSWKKGLILGAALAAVLGTTAFAAELLKWDDATVNFFGNPPREMQEKLTAYGVVSQQGDSDTDAGITVTAVETVMDQQKIYILLKVTAEEPVIGGWGFLKWELRTKEGEPVRFAEGEKSYRFDNGMSGTALSKEGFLSLTVASNERNRGMDFDSLIISLTGYTNGSGALGFHDPSFIEGHWEVELNVDHEAAKELTRTYENGQVISIDNEWVTVENIRLTPLTLRMILRKAEVLEGTEEYREKNESWEFYGVAYADGTVEAIFASSYGLEKPDEGDWEMNASFRNIVDVENVTAILLGDNGEIRVELGGKGVVKSGIKMP